MRFICRFSLVLVFIFCTAISSFAQQNNLSVFAMDKNALVTNKSKLKSGDKALAPAYENLVDKANKIIAQQPIVSVMEKSGMPPSGDMHDYMSLALYFWPDPTKADGLPYIRKDGEINPEVHTYKDKRNMMDMSASIESLALAYYFSDDKKFSARAIQQLRAWFLDPATKMNPNFNFAQAVRGKNDGRGIGIIECRILINVIDAIGLIKSDPSWTKKDQQGMETWFSDFLQWFITSKNGIEEMNTKNNHGIWYDAQKLSFALFTHNDEVAKSTVKSIQSRLEYQMDSTGFFPAELERTISLHYSVFIIEPLFMIANMSNATGVDMWHYTSPTGRSIEKGFNVLKPYISKEKDWFGQQIKPFEFSSNGTPILAQGYYKYNCTTCRDAIYKIFSDDKEAQKSIIHLTSLID